MKPFYNMPPPWNPGYAIPDYVLAEPPARGAFTTYWLPRGTIYPIEPEQSVGMKLLGRGDAGLSGFSQPLGTLSGPTLAKHTLTGSSLGDTAPVPVPVPAPVPTAPAPSSSFDPKTLALLGGAAAAAYFLLRKKKRRK